MATLAASSLLTACSPMPSTTIESPDAFRQHALRVQLDSPSSAEDLARCFEESAGLLPGSTITPFPASDEFTYRLRAGQFVFESISFSPRVEGGSRALVEVTPDYKRRMQADFVSNRLAPLHRCAGTSDTAQWPVPSVASAAAPVSR
jgi:hypothetical protein